MAALAANTEPLRLLQVPRTGNNNNNNTQIYLTSTMPYIELRNKI